MTTSSRPSPSKGSIRIIVTVITILFIVGGVTVWIFSIDTAAARSWTDIIAAIFVAVGIIVAVLQWLWPIGSVGKVLNESGETRKLVIYTNRDLRGKSIHLYNGFLNYTSIALAAPVHSAANVVERPLAGQPEFMAVFYVIPGKYTACVYEGIHRHHELVTVTAENMTEVDWR